MRFHDVNATIGIRMVRVRTSSNLFAIDDLPGDPDAWISTLIHQVNALPEMGMSPTPTCGWIEPDGQMGYFGLQPAAWSANMVRAVEEVLTREEVEAGVSFTSATVSRRNDPRERFPIGVVAWVELKDDRAWWSDGPTERLVSFVDSVVATDQPGVWATNSLVHTKAVLGDLIPLLMRTFFSIKMEWREDGPVELLGVSIDREGRLSLYARGDLTWRDDWAAAAAKLADLAIGLATTDHPSLLVPWARPGLVGMSSPVRYQGGRDLPELSAERPLWSSTGPGTGVWHEELRDHWPRHLLE